MKALVAVAHQDAQEIITLFAQAAKAFGLKISITKKKQYINLYQGFMMKEIQSY